MRQPLFLTEAEALSLTHKSFPENTHKASQLYLNILYTLYTIYCYYILYYTIYNIYYMTLIISGDDLSASSEESDLPAPS